MNVQFITSVSVVAPDPPKSRELFVDALGLPLQASEGSDYFHSERIGGSKHFGVWPLAEAAQACFGATEWPADRPVPQVSLEFEVEDANAVQAAADELSARGYHVRPQRASTRSRLSKQIPQPSPIGRDEGGDRPFWLRRHDEYETT